MNPKASLVLGILFISFSPIFVKLAVASPITSGFYRIFVAWVVLAPYCFIKGDLKIARKDLLIALLGGIIFGADIAVWNISLTKISATISTLIANLAPVWVGLLSFLILRKKSGISFWAGTSVAVIGMVILVGYQNIRHLQFNIGIIYALVASLFYAIYIMITKDILKKISTVTFMFYNMIGASVFMLLICLTRGDELFHFSTPTWLYMIGMGLICQLAGWLTINYSLNFLQATRVSIALLSQTVIAGIWAALLLHEKLDLKEIIGSVIVLAGIAITFLKRRSSAENA
ncbi:MAG TPA: DMT family transporter [Mucilaginibacter sp.]|jgi:drug/metabolite transporter (DMT)-like permease|nr:DMT family transporter [Mucilaginibacter sp.]